MRTGRLPLGIDIGKTRIRIAEVSIEDGIPTLVRVASLDTGANSDPAHIGAALLLKLRELRFRERRCVLAVPEPEGTLRTVSFPPMSLRERARAATFEAKRFIEDDTMPVTVRTAPIDAALGLYALGIVRTPALERRMQIASAAMLRPLAVDHEAYALKRAFPFADAVLDMGAVSARLYTYGHGAPVGVSLEAGSETFTTAISRSLGIDPATAERRKRATGFAGAGESELAAFAHSVGRGLFSAQSQGVTDIQRMVITGNGARLLGLAARLERDTGCSVDVASSAAVPKSTYPEDIVRASAPDWALAIGLATWDIAAQAAA